MKFILKLAMVYLWSSFGGVMAQNNENILKSEEILRGINKYRQMKGLGALVNQADIAKEAYEHSKNMAEGKVPFSHDGFEGRAKRLMKKVPNTNTIAENVAYGKLSSDEVIQKWIQSEGHRKNIEGKYGLSGIGVYQRKDGYLFFTQIFMN